MKVSQQQLVVRIALALAALLGGAPGPLAALHDTVTPGGGGVIQSGTDGVGGIEKAPKLDERVVTPGQSASVPAETTAMAGGEKGGAPTVGPWTDLGSGTPGTVGMPHLSGAGAGAPGSQVFLLLQAARPGAAATLIVGLGAAPTAFKGGTLVPSPGLVVMGLPITLDGTLLVSAKLPAALHSGQSLCAQFWIPDAAAVQGFAASNGLLLQVP